MPLEPNAADSTTVDDDPSGVTTLQDDPAQWSRPGRPSPWRGDAEHGIAAVLPIPSLPRNGTVYAARWGNEHRFLEGCSAILVPESPGLQLLGDRLLTAVQPMRAVPPATKTAQETGRADGSQPKAPPRLPAPNNDAPIPTAPGSLLGGSSGGSQSAPVIGVVGVVSSLVPPLQHRLVALVERQGRALHLFFFLERPG
jgi:hypothetical protein